MISSDIKNETVNNIDQVVRDAVFGESNELAKARWKIWETAQDLNIKPSSIHDLYIARGKNKLGHDFTVPAINLRGIAYDMAQCVFKVANKLNVKALIFELARSEMGYTNQPPQEYVSVVLAAAIKTGYEGPVFIQGDHFQTKQDGPGKPKEGEVETIKELIAEAVGAGFYNIDIDTSTLVDLEQPKEEDQQKPNIDFSLELTKHARSIEPRGITLSLGGEIGHIGGKNSTVEDFDAYIEGFNKGLPNGMTGMSKISIQTGTSHGGVVMADGSLADIDVDFGVLLDISRACRKYGIGGAVQHGASTLPDNFFREFPRSEAIEVHLATGFQNIIMDHPDFPPELLKKMYDWLDSEKAGERKDGQTDEQFHYKTRKKAWGKFKRECWDIPEDKKTKIRKSLMDRFEFMFKELNVVNTEEMVKKIIKPLTINKKPEDFTTETVTKKSVKGLSD